MFKKIFLLLIFTVTQIHASLIIEPCRFEEIEACRKVFITAFLKAYKDLTPGQLGISDKESFLEEAFLDLYLEFLSGEQDLLLAKSDGKVIGLIGFKETEKSHQIYISQLAVDPDHWGEEIGSRLVLSAFDIFEDVQSLVVIPRKVNSVAQTFYQKLGFAPSSYMHPGYSAEKYIGLEWSRPPQHGCESLNFSVPGQ